MNTEPDIYLFLAQAAANPSNERYPTGEKHSLLVLVRGKEIQKAEEVALKELATHGWIDIAFEEKAKFNSSSLDEGEEYMVYAYNSAKRDGICVVMFPDPLK